MTTINFIKSNAYFNDGFTHILYRSIIYKEINVSNFYIFTDINRMDFKNYEKSNNAFVSNEIFDLRGENIIGIQKNQLKQIKEKFDYFLGEKL